ncbi:hypothetical protein GGI03_001094 [Coemansia sp. RSA 2337]|nr:hypothetical protein H4S03_003814 [Coemansia sp. S3946]KAJ2427205.1 hypothetical protein GGF41_001769 [Coemansia sp. RSA 2531]KAJ2468273.1 hypothetical protein GGI03_001094 [Coemansia sp. RSA 2337]
MFANTVSVVSLLTFALLAITTDAHPQPQPQPQVHASGVFVKRYGGYGGYGGYGAYGGYGYPFVSSFTSDFDRNSNRANFNENTLYANNVNANAASDNIHAFTNANVIA